MSANLELKPEVKLNNEKTNLLTKFLASGNTAIVLIALILMVAIFSILSPYFLSVKNFYAVGLTISVLGIVCIGQSLCILTGGFDLSVGAISGFCGISVAYLTLHGTPYILSVIIALALGVLAGLINGLLIAKAKINAFITTLSFMSIYQGLVLIISKGYAIMVPARDFAFLGQTKVFGIPLPIIILIILYIIFYIILKNTLFGRYVYCIGGNREAAKISGLNVDRIQTLVYTISGLLAAFGGIILSSRLGAAQTTAGLNYALDSVAAVVLGGTALSGGKGNVLGTLIGITILGVLQNGLIMVNMPSYYQFVATGVVLIIAVLVQNIDVNKKAKKK